ncbi:MAG: hypothetical protein FJ011_26420 [Chloroflexi bacterium]|nr:hypothetical protein [Chloroflexota bacterium]
MTAEELLRTKTEKEIEQLQESLRPAYREARRKGLPFIELDKQSDAIQLALIAYRDARIFVRKLVTRGQENVAFVEQEHDARWERKMFVVNSHVLDSEPVVVVEPFDYSR